MANENNKINELVSDDDDPTAELDVAALRESLSDDAVIERESDAHTHGANSSDQDDSAHGQSIPELQQDINRRTKTIGRLQYDIEQLRSKWLGLETEISAREEIVSKLNREVDELRSDVAQKDKLLKKRNKAIKKFKSKIADLDAKYEQLAKERTESNHQIDELRSTETDHVKALEVALRELDGVRSELRSVEEKAASLETDFESRSDEYRSLEQQHAVVSQELAELRATYADNVAALDHSNIELKARQSDIESSTQKIASFESEIAQLDEAKGTLQQQNADLAAQLDEQRSIVAENHTALDTADREIERLGFELESALNQGPPEIVLSDLSTSDAKEIQAQIARTEEYADSLRHKLQDLTESYSAVSTERDKLSRSLKRMTDQNLALNDDIAAANTSIADLQSAVAKQHEEQKAAFADQQKQHMAALEKLHEDHEQEIRNLRFELGEAQNTVAETTDMNSQLASELIHTKEFKDDLEKMLSRNDDQSQQQIVELEKQIKRLTRTTEDFEQKLDTKSTAINVLLGELARKSEQIDSIGEIEQVIHDIDDRMSGRLDDDSVVKEAQSKPNPKPESKPEPKPETRQEPEPTEAAPDRERITRVLVGNIGDQILRFPLFKDRLTIGRTDENDIQLKTSFVSRRHAVVLTEGDNTRVIDWGSTNGLFVNSKRIKEHLLSNGDIIAVGDAEFRYEERQKRDA